MTKDDAVNFFGSQVALARALHIKKASVNQWEEIPLVRQCQVEVITDGALLADRDLLFPKAATNHDLPRQPDV